MENLCSFSRPAAWMLVGWSIVWLISEWVSQEYTTAFVHCSPDLLQMIREQFYSILAQKSALQSFTIGCCSLTNCGKPGSTQPLKRNDHDAGRVSRRWWSSSQGKEFVFPCTVHSLVFVTLMAVQCTENRVQITYQSSSRRLQCLIVCPLQTCSQQNKFITVAP
jgi:hypothetical protein